MPNFTGALAALSGLPQGWMDAQRFNQQQAEQQALLELNKLRMQEIARQRLQEQQQAKLAFGAAQNLFGQPQQPMVPQQQQPMVPSGGMNLPAAPSYGPGGGMPTDAQLDLARRAMAQGYPPAAAAGMAGSMTGESGRNLDPYALNPRSGALGEAQWLGPRKAALLSRPNPLSRETQTGFLFDELRGPEASTGQRLMSATDPAQAARDFTTGFERPGNVNMAPREQAARAVYAQLSPDQQMQAQDAAVSTAAAIPPQMAGRLTISQLAQAINRQAGPEVSDEAKFGALVALSKLAMPDQQQQLHQQWEAFKFGVGEQDKAATRAETAARDRATAEYRQQRLAQGAGGAVAGGEGAMRAGKNFEITNKETGESRTVYASAQKNKAGLVDAMTGQPIPFDPSKETIKEVSASAAIGGRAAAQIGRQITAGTEVKADLQNVVSMPVGTTTGLFGSQGLQHGLVGALKTDLGTQLTSEDEINMKQAMAGLGQELSMLMQPVYGGRWAAENLEPLIPRAGYTVGNALYGIARIKQAAVNALQSLEVSPIVSQDQKKFAKEMEKTMETTVPWSVADVLAYEHQGKEEESFGDFAKRAGVSGAAEGQQGAGQAVPVPDEFKNDPDGTTYNNGRLVKRGNQLVPQ